VSRLDPTVSSDPNSVGEASTPMTTIAQTRDLAERLAGLSPAKRALLEQRLGARARGSSEGPPDRPIVPRILRARAPLSYPQQRLWLLHQMDPANAREAVREVLADIEEGADAVMVKPAGPCLDIITLVRKVTDYPVAAYQVSGEYAMIRAAADRGWINGDRVIIESLLGIRRAGADFILTYFAVDAARLLNAGAKP